MDIKSVYKPVLTSSSQPPRLMRKADYIYLDSAASTPLIPEAKEAMEEYYFDNFANSSSAHAAGRRVKEAIENARAVAAECLNAGCGEIIFTSGASEALNMAIFGYYHLEPSRAAGKNIAVSAIEHHASLYPSLEMKKYDANVIEIAPESDGAVDCAGFEAAAAKAKKIDFVSIMLVNNETGVIQPVAALSEIARRYGACFLCDAVAGLGKVPIDVRALGVDMLALSAHKFYGPKGCGILYVKKGTRLNPRTLGGGHEFNLRAGTLNAPAVIGAVAALKKAVSDFKKREKHCLLLKNYLYKKFEIFKENNIEIRYNSPADKTVSSTVNLSFKNIEAEKLVEYLSDKGIMVSAGSACNAKSGSKASHVIEAMGVPFEYSMGAVRISFGIYNELCDIDILTSAILAIVKK
jgi:cysteine desulfurase